MDGFAAVLRSLREARSLTQEELAERAGLTVKAVGALERGERRRPYPHTVRALADALDADEDGRAALVAAVPPRTRTAGGPVPAEVPAPAPGDLRPPPGPVFGREADVERVVALLRARGRPIVSLTGLGGIGKTTLALVVADRVRGDFPGGVVLVELAGVTDPVRVLPAVATALGVPDAEPAGTAAGLAPYLSGRRLLVVLDNVEHVIACAPEVAALAVQCPDVGFLVTSQVPLRVRAEHEIRVDPLDVGPAVALFRDRAAAGGRPAQDGDGDLTRICRRLDGIPLAVELAASASALLGPAALLARLDALPETGSRDLPERQRTMTVCLDRSHHLLGPAEQDVLARLSVFAGGFSLAGAEAVAGDDAVGGLRALLDHAFVVRGDDVHGSERFRLLEPVRRYAAQRLGDDDRADAAERHTRHVQAVARDLAPDLRGPHLRPALDLLAADHADLCAVARRLAEQGRDDELGDLVGHVWLYLALRGHAREGLAWLDRPGTGANRLLALAGLSYVVGMIPAVRDAGEAAVALYRDRDDPDLLGEALVLAASGALFSGDLDRARALLDDGAAAGLPRWADGHLLMVRGQVALLAGELDEADRLLRDAESRGRAFGNAFALATTLNVRATLAGLRDDHATAAVLLAEAAELSVGASISWTLAYTLPSLAGVAVRLGDHATGARLFGASASYNARHDVSAGFPADRALADRDLATARATLGADRFRDEWDVGRDATGVDVVALARTLSERARG